MFDKKHKLAFSSPSFDKMNGPERHRRAPFMENCAVVFYTPVPWIKRVPVRQYLFYFDKSLFHNTLISYLR